MSLFFRALQTPYRHGVASLNSAEYLISQRSYKQSSQAPTCAVRSLVSTSYSFFGRVQINDNSTICKMGKEKLPASLPFLTRRDFSIKRETWNATASQINVAPSESSQQYKHLTVKQTDDKVLHVQLSRAAKGNSLNRQLWDELYSVFANFSLSPYAHCRAIVLSGDGKHFCTGIDLEVLQSLATRSEISRDAFRLHESIGFFQSVVTGIELCPVPVIAAVHGACIGAGVDIITACDMRYCTKDAVFSVKEVDVGLAADVGTLQRLPKVVRSESWVREVTYTARNFGAEEAHKEGLVGQLFDNIDDLHRHSLELASTIASKSPVAVRGSKLSLNYSRDHSVAEGLEHIRTWNMAMLQSSDLETSVKAAMTRTSPKYDDIK